MNILLEIHYLPSVQYAAHFLGSETVLLDDTEHFEKQSYRNRCYIAGANGPIALSIPLYDSRGKIPMREIRIDNSVPWQRQHWQSIRSAYGRAAFFEHYADVFQRYYLDQTYTCLWDWNLGLMELFCKLLKVSSGHWNLKSSGSAGIHDSVKGMRSYIHPKANHAKPDPAFQPLPYMQVFRERFGFQPNLSWIDVLFNEGPESSNIITGSLKQD